MDIAVTVVDNGKLLKTQTLGDDNKVTPYFETIEKDEQGNQYFDKNSEDWLYKMNGFESKEKYLESIQRTFVINDKNTQYDPSAKVDTDLVTTTATLQLWKESDGRGCQVYTLLNKQMPISQSFDLTIKDGNTDAKYNIYNKYRTNLVSPVYKDGLLKYKLNNEEEITVGGLDDYSKKYNIMLEEYYMDFEVQKCDLEISSSKVYTIDGEETEVCDLYKQNMKPIHFTFDEENNNIVLISDNDICEISIVDFVDIDGNYVDGYMNKHASLIATEKNVSSSYKYANPSGKCYNLKVAWRAEVDHYNLKFAKIQVVKDNEATYYYMIIDYNSENKYRSYKTLEEAQSQL